MSTWWETVTDGRFATDPAGAAAVPAVAGGGDLVFVQATTQGSAGISCYLIIGVVLGCVSLLGLVAGIWLLRRQKQQQQQQQAAPAAAAAPPLTLDLECGAGPHLPRIPVVVVGPGGAPSFGWQLEAPAAGKPAPGSPTGVAGSDGELGSAGPSCSLSSSPSCGSLPSSSAAEEGGKAPQRGRSPPRGDAAQPTPTAAAPPPPPPAAPAATAAAAPAQAPAGQQPPAVVFRTVSTRRRSVDDELWPPRPRARRPAPLRIALPPSQRPHPPLYSIQVMAPPELHADADADAGPADAPPGEAASSSSADEPGAAASRSEPAAPAQ